MRRTGSSRMSTFARAQYGHSRSAYASSSGPSPREWSSSAGGGGALEPRSPSGGACKGVEDQVRAGYLERARRAVRPDDAQVRADHHERTLAVAPLVAVDAVAARHLSLRVEVGEQR